MAFYSMKSLALAAAMAISAAGVQAATISLGALPGTAVQNPIAAPISGTVHQNVTGCIDHNTMTSVSCATWDPEDVLEDGDARSVWHFPGSPIDPDAADAWYSSVSGNASATFSFDTARSLLKLVWGSVDTYNEIAFYSGDLLKGIVTGADIFAAGFAGVAQRDSTWVEISGLGSFDRIILTSGTRDAFEFSNLAAVPLPAGGLLLISALGAAAALRRRKTA